MVVGTLHLEYERHALGAFSNAGTLQEMLKSEGDDEDTTPLVCFDEVAKGNFPVTRVLAEVRRQA